MKYVVIGSSAAGVNAVRELRRLDKESSIVLLSKDKDIYSRCILHEYDQYLRHGADAAAGFQYRAL